MSKKTGLPNWLFEINLDVEKKFAYICLWQLALQRTSIAFTDTRINIVNTVMKMGNWRTFDTVEQLIVMLNILGLLEITHTRQRADHAQGASDLLWTIRLTQPSQDTLDQLSRENAFLLYDELLNLARSYGCTFEERARPGVGTGTEGIILYKETRITIGPYATDDPSSDRRWWSRKQWRQVFEQIVCTSGGVELASQQEEDLAL